MIKILSILLLLTIINCELKFVVEIFRHGARGSSQPFYDGPGQNQELSPTGMRQQYILGQMLRKEYIETKNFLNATYNYSEIYVRSDDVNRTLQSAYSQLYGLFPIGTGPDLPEGLDKEKYTLPPYKGIKYQDFGESALVYNLRPVPVHTMFEKDDQVINPQDQCKNLLNIVGTFLAEKTLQIAEIQSQFKTTFDQVTRLINSKEQINLSSILAVYDVLIADLYNGHKMPDGFSVNSELWKNITFLASYEAEFIFQSKKIVKLVNTYYFKYIIKYLDNSLQKENGGLKWLMLSAHDTNLQAIGTGLNITSAECIHQLFFKNFTTHFNCESYPIFASNLIVELYDNNNKTTINMKYNGEYVHLCDKYQLSCDYAEWRQRVLDTTYSQEEFDQICENNNLNKQQILNQLQVEGGIFVPYLLIQVGLGIVFAVLMVIMIRQQKQKKNISLEITLNDETVYGD